jgi:4-diphosphocytidyl-2-C-methyl-D-erythritol kinase
MGRDRPRRRGDRVSARTDREGAAGGGRWSAFAKLTLSLRVLGLRSDGYHEVDALTVSMSEPHDELTIRLRRGRGGERVVLTVSGPAAGAVATGPDNLVMQAAHAFFAHVGEADAAVEVALRKQIPAGAGLGGGSADAAATLLALDSLLDAHLPVDEIAAIGASLGSDVPFCVRGGAARMRGRGERIEPASVPELAVLVAVPSFAIATPAVYGAWDALGGPASVRVVAGPAGVGPLANDLEPAAERVEPRLREFREQLERVAGAPAILAGSGSACAVLHDDRAAAVSARDRVAAAKIASTCVVGVTRSSGAEPVGAVTEDP